MQVLEGEFAQAYNRQGHPQAGAGVDRKHCGRLGVIRARGGPKDSATAAVGNQTLGRALAVA
jgi:hypothetical protein